MPSGMTSAKRFAVRTALVTSSTLATIIGAESLAMLDNQQQEISIAAVPTAKNQVAISNINPTVAGPVINAAPSIVIIRHAAQTTTTGPATQPIPSVPVVIQPPSPVAVQAPATIIVQSSSQDNFTMPVQPVTQSSR